MTIGISSVGVYLPRTRLQRKAIADAHAWAVPSLKGLGKGQLSVANWDEDSITMAHAAARALPGDATRALTFCSTSMPFADRSHASLLVEALQLPTNARTQDVSGSSRAATAALLDAFEHDSMGSIVVAAEKRLAKPGSPLELQYGDGAVALQIDDAALLAEYVAGNSFATDFVDSYRRNDAQFDYAFEDRWVRDEGVIGQLPAHIATLLGNAGIDAQDVTHLVANLPSRVRSKLATVAGLANADSAQRYEHEVGRAGCAESLIGLSEVLGTAAPGALILCIGFGQGADMMLLRATGAGRDHDAFSAAVSRGAADENYLKFLSHRNLLQMDWGKRAERDVRTAQSAYYRERDQISGFVGGRCTQCGTIQFPRTQACVNPECRAFGEQAPQPFADLIGRIKSFTEDWQAYSPAPPLIYGNIEFEGGANILMQFTDTQAGQVTVGDNVHMHFRIKDIDRARHFQRYFWKAVPTQEG